MADLKKEIELIDKKIKQVGKELADLRRCRKQLVDTMTTLDKIHNKPDTESGSGSGQAGTETPLAPGQGES